MRQLYDTFLQVTFVADFCCHAHKDHCNTEGGVTTILTVTSEIVPVQLHVLHEYKLEEVFPFTRFLVLTLFFSQGEDVGIGFHLPGGSFLFESSRTELHSTSKVEDSSKGKPKRLGIVLYRHRGLDKQSHGNPE